MAITKRDVQLVVRARDEATRVVDKYAESIAKVTKAQNIAGSSADGLSGDLVGLLAALADVEKANGLVSAAADRADASFKRQSAGLNETRAQLAATRAQIDNVQQALANGPQRIVDTLLGGGDASRVRAEMAGAQQALGQLVNTENRLAQSVRNQEAALGEQRSSLQQLGSLASGLTGMMSAAPMIAAGTTLAASGAALAASGGVLTSSAAMWMATASQIMAAAVMLMAANAASGGTAGIFHSGGIAGSGGRSRPVAPAWFAGATRYHSGGLAGFAPNEVPIIAERGEEILQRSDPRHRMNGGIRGGGAGTSGGRSKTEIFAIGDKEIVSAMASASGEEVVLRMLKRNKETVRQMLRD